MNGIFSLIDVVRSGKRPRKRSGGSDYLRVSDAAKCFRGKRVCSFTGYRPEKVGVENESTPECMELRYRIFCEVMEAIDRGVNVFISGMARGVDTWAAEAVLDAIYCYGRNAELYAALPCPEQADSWMGWEKERYNDILTFSHGVFLVSDKYFAGCMRKRNEFLVDNADEILAVFDGKNGGTATTVELAEKRGLQIKIITP